MFGAYFKVYQHIQSPSAAIHISIEIERLQPLVSARVNLDQVENIVFNSIPLILYPLPAGPWGWYIGLEKLNL